MPILVFLCLCVPVLGPMYATDVRQTSDSIIALCPRLLGAGHNNVCLSDMNVYLISDLLYVKRISVYWLMTLIL